MALAFIAWEGELPFVVVQLVKEVCSGSSVGPIGDPLAEGGAGAVGLPPPPYDVSQIISSTANNGDKAKP